MHSGIIVGLGALFVAQETPSPSDSLALLRRRLEARDAQIQNVFLAYEAATVFEEGVTADKRHRESGWWYWEDGLQAAAALSEYDAQGPRWEHVVYDGTKARRRWGPATWADADKLFEGEFPGFSRVEVTNKLRGFRLSCG